MSGRWRALSPGARYLFAGVAVLLGLNALVAGLEAAVGRDPAGPPSSSYATAPSGLAAYADLLEARGHPVGRLRTSLDRARLDPAATLVVADAAGVSGAEARAVRGFVSAGGRLVVTGGGAEDVLDEFPIGGLEWSSGGVDTAVPVVPVPETAGVVTVRAGGAGSWRDAGGSLPVLASDTTVLATVYSLDAGGVVALADTSPWQNRLLDEADNAAFALAAAGEPGRPVLFAEAHHGYGASQGLAALPARWKWALAGAAVAALAAMWARGKRLGPPEDVDRPLPPPRRAFVDALAASLARTRRPADAVRPLQDAIRRQVARRAALASDADDRTICEAGARVGVPEEDLAAALAPVRGDDDLLAVGRVLARLERGPGR